MRYSEMTLQDRQAVFSHGVSGQVQPARFTTEDHTTIGT